MSADHRQAVNFSVKISYEKLRVAEEQICTYSMLFPTTKNEAGFQRSRWHSNWLRVIIERKVEQYVAPKCHLMF